MDPDVFNLVLFGFRIAVGLTMFAHGYNKAFRGGKLEGTARWFDSIGMKPGAVQARLAASTEMLTGSLLALGLLTTFASAGVIGLMVVAGWTVHRLNGFFIVKEGWEYVFILAMSALVIATLGPGAWSIDDAIGVADDLDGSAGLLIALVVGLGGGVSQLALFFRPPAPVDTTG